MKTVRISVACGRPPAVLPYSSTSERRCIAYNCGVGHCGCWEEQLPHTYDRGASSTASVFCRSTPGPEGRPPVNSSSQCAPYTAPSSLVKCRDCQTFNRRSDGPTQRRATSRQSPRRPTNLTDSHRPGFTSFTRLATQRVTAGTCEHSPGWLGPHLHRTKSDPRFSFSCAPLSSSRL